MKQEGLVLEYEGKEQSQDGKTAFVKVHGSWEALSRQAEFESLQMPIMESDLDPPRKGIIHRMVMLKTPHSLIHYISTLKVYHCHFGCLAAKISRRIGRSNKGFVRASAGISHSQKGIFY